MDFLKMGSIKLGSQTSKNWLSGESTVCIKHKDGRVTEHSGITDPWRYIIKVKKSMDVENAWISNK